MLDRVSERDNGMPGQGSEALRWRRATGVLETEVAGTRILMNPATWRYTELNASAARIWDLLAAAPTLDDLVATLRRAYAIGASECRADAEACLAELQSAGLVSGDDRNN
jgi:hypothetical protein